MEIKPIRNLKKPAYAVGVSLMAAALLTACYPGVRLDGETEVYNTTDETPCVSLDGAVAIATDTESTKETDIDAVETKVDPVPACTTEFVLEGEMPNYPEPSEK